MEPQHPLPPAGPRRRPARRLRALDVGCGEGTLARQLRPLVPRVTAIDTDPDSIALARQHAGPDVEYLLGDFLTFPFQPASFDFIASVATLHHMDAGAALTRMRDLLRPGGKLAIIGLPRPALPADLPWLLASTAASALHRLTRRYLEHPSPTLWPPPETYAACAASPPTFSPAPASAATSSGATRSYGRSLGRPERTATAGSHRAERKQTRPCLCNFAPALS